MKYNDIHQRWHYDHSDKSLTSKKKNLTCHQQRASSTLRQSLTEDEFYYLLARMQTPKYWKFLNARV